MTKIRRLVFGACIAALCVTQARAGALEDDYIKARDAYIAKFNSGGKEIDWDKLQKPHEAAIADLETRLREVIGDGAVRNADAGKNNLMSLAKGDMDYGKLDGLLFRMNGSKAEVVVTTKALLTKYLVGHKEWWGTGDVPQTIPEALAFANFYTQALMGDAAVTKYAELPVTKPADAELAFAMLDERDQNAGVGKADEIIVALVRGERVYIVSSPVDGKAPAFAPCDAAWNVVQKKVARTDGARAEGIELDGADAYRRCYAGKLKATPQFRALTAQAQKLIDALDR